VAKCKHHASFETIGTCQCGNMICKECIRQGSMGQVGSGRAFQVGCIKCIPHGERPPQAVVDFMERDFIRRASPE
jgi:hypothetical protein